MKTLCATAVRSQASNWEMLLPRGNSHLLTAPLKCLPAFLQHLEIFLSGSVATAIQAIRPLDGQLGFFLCLLFERTFER
jgi:hypothetical protein